VVERPKRQPVGDQRLRAEEGAHSPVRMMIPPSRNPLANGIAIGMRIALFILVPLGIIAAIAILFLHR
jgi:hypothetical protein